MKRKMAESKSTKTKNPWVRASISFPSSIYQSLEAIAKRKKVSLAWVVRDAAEQYVTAQESVSEKYSGR